MHEISVRDYTVRCGTETVFGRLYAPADGDRFPAVIISHGYNGRHLDWVKEGTYLAEHGTDDAVVPIAYSEKAADIYPDARLRVLPGEGHGFTADAGEKVIREVADFVEQNLG